MEYECGPLLLYSQDKTRMMDFLSDVFEFDVDSVTDNVFRDSLSLKLFEIKEKIPYQANIGSLGVIFSFKVKSELELKEIMSKYNFFLYRKNQILTRTEKLELVQNERQKILTITDIDQRVWRFVFDIGLDFVL